MKHKAGIYAILILSLCSGTAAGQFTREIPDTISGSSDEKLDSLQAQVARNSLGKLLDDFVFVTKLDTASVGRGAVKSEDPYIPYLGRFIRHVEIYRFNVFSDTEVGADNPDVPGFIRAIEWIHKDTRISKISSYLLFEEGDPVDRRHVLEDVLDPVEPGDPPGHVLAARAEEAQQAAAASAREPTSDGVRRGHVISIQGDDIFVDLGGKSQGLLQSGN